MAAALISPLEIKIGSELLSWAASHLMQSDVRIKRPYAPQTVCPFASSSVRKNVFLFAFHGEIVNDATSAIKEIVDGHIDRFPPTDGMHSYTALLIVFPRLDPDRYAALDQFQALAKDSVVERGFMLGQFHPHCRTTAVHNPSWDSVSVAPYPLIALRKMVLHDIIFLQTKKHWFVQYAERFGVLLERSKSCNASHAHLWATYTTAREKFLGGRPECLQVEPQ